MAKHPLPFRLAPLLEDVEQPSGAFVLGSSGRVPGGSGVGQLTVGEAAADEDRLVERDDAGVGRAGERGRGNPPITAKISLSWVSDVQTRSASIASTGL